MGAIRVLAPIGAEATATVNGQPASFGKWLDVGGQGGPIEVVLSLPSPHGEVRLRRTFGLGADELATVSWPHSAVTGAPNAEALTSAVGQLLPAMTSLAAQQPVDVQALVHLVLVQAAAGIVGTLLTNRPLSGDDWSAIVGYDLHGARRDYRHLLTALRELGATRVLESLWLVTQQDSASGQALFDRLAPYVDSDDALVVLHRDGTLRSNQAVGP